MMRDRIIEEILQEYDQIRQDEARALQAREQEVADKISEFSSIHDKIIDLMAQISKMIIQDPSKSDRIINEMQEKVSYYKMHQVELLKANGFPPDYLSPRYLCNRCKDTGYVGDMIKERCQCFIQKILVKTYELSDIYDLQKENFDTFDPSVFPDVCPNGSRISQRDYMVNLKNRFLDYADKFPDNDKKTILFTGKTGLGKTFLLNCIAKAIMDKGFSVVRITAYKLFDRLFISALKDIEKNEHLINLLFEVDVLIIDDLGTETRRNNFTTEDLYNILNERQLINKHTFLSTNLGLGELKERYSDRIASRLFDTSNTMLIKFIGRDIRIKPTTTNI